MVYLRCATRVGPSREYFPHRRCFFNPLDYHTKLSPSAFFVHFWTIARSLKPYCTVEIQCHMWPLLRAVSESKRRSVIQSVTHPEHLITLLRWLRLKHFCAPTFLHLIRMHWSAAVFHSNSKVPQYNRLHIAGTWVWRTVHRSSLVSQTLRKGVCKRMTMTRHEGQEDKRVDENLSIQQVLYVIGNFLI